MKRSEANSRRVRGLGLRSLWVAVLANLMLAAPVAAEPGQLDLSFSRDGRVVTQFPAEAVPYPYSSYAPDRGFAANRFPMALTPGGGVVAASSKKLVQYLATGQPNPRFGRNGQVPIPTVNGSLFRVSAIAVDFRGRIVVAGTAKLNPPRQMGGNPLPGPVPSAARVIRFLPNGALDRGFGEGGVSTSTLGAEPPVYQDGGPYEAAAVSVLGLTVDNFGRPVLSGAASDAIGNCGNPDITFESRHAFIARLTKSGDPDRTFAEGGLKPVGGLTELKSPAASQSGGILSIGSYSRPCTRYELPYPSVLVGLTPTGTPDGGFAGGGFWSRRFEGSYKVLVVNDLSVTPAGTILLLAQTAVSPFADEPTMSKVLRLLPDGRPDPAFGRRGSLTLPLGQRAEFSAISPGPRDEVLLAGSVSRRPAAVSDQGRSQLLLMRLTSAGRVDRSFGRAGRVATRFRGATVTATDLAVDPRGRIVVGGRLFNRHLATPNLLGLARYLGDEAARRPTTATGGRAGH